MKRTDIKIGQTYEIDTDPQRKRGLRSGGTIIAEVLGFDAYLKRGRYGGKGQALTGVRLRLVAMKTRGEWLTDSNAFQVFVEDREDSRVANLKKQGYKEVDRDESIKFSGPGQYGYSRATADNDWCFTVPTKCVIRESSLMDQYHEEALVMDKNMRIKEVEELRKAEAERLHARAEELGIADIFYYKDKHPMHVHLTHDMLDRLVEALGPKD